VDAFKNQWRKEKEETNQREKKNEQMRGRRCVWQTGSKRDCERESFCGCKDNAEKLRETDLIQAHFCARQPLKNSVIELILCPIKILI
jgi:hypothetical protein